MAEMELNDDALITGCDRMEVKKYSDDIAAISAKLAMKYFSVVNFVCLPYDEFTENQQTIEHFTQWKRE